MKKKYIIKKGIHVEAEKQMADVLDQLGEDAILYKVSLDILTDALDMFNKAIDGINQGGAVITNMQGNLVANPWVKIKKENQTTAWNIMKTFAGSPLDRKKLEKDVPEEEDSALYEFMKGGK